MKKCTIILLVIAICLLSGCGHKETSEEFIERTMAPITDAIESRDADEIGSYFEDLDADSLRDIEKFVDNCAPISRIYVDYGGFSYGKGTEDGVKYKNVRTLSGLILTEDDLYEFLIDYTEYDKERIVINNLWIITGKTQAVENVKQHTKYDVDRDRKFAYVDYYDNEAVDEYRLIWGKILFWNDDAACYNDIDAKGMSRDEVIASYGEPGAEYDTGSGYHILFYETSKEDEYIALFLDYDDIVDDVKKTDSIFYGITGIR